MQSVPSPHPLPFPSGGGWGGGVGGAKRWMTFQTVNTLVSMKRLITRFAISFLNLVKPLVLVFTSKRSK